MTTNEQNQVCLPRGGIAFHKCSSPTDSQYYFGQNLLQEADRHKPQESTLRKLILDTCTKTVFSCNNKLFEQTDGVSMGGSLGPVLANIIMTKFERSRQTSHRL